MRLFTLGCSFTNYCWPTWSDILSKASRLEWYQAALAGAGNAFIFQSMVDLHVTHQITPDDIVVICWTSFMREDRFLNGKWHVGGNVFNTNTYSHDFIKKYCDTEHFVRRDCAHIAGTMHFLDSLGCSVTHVAMQPFHRVDDLTHGCFTEAEQRHMARYESYFARIQPSYREVIFNDCVWDAEAQAKRPLHPLGFRDFHPTPLEHLRYVEEVILPTLPVPVAISDRLRATITEMDRKIWANEPYPNPLMLDISNT